MIDAIIVILKGNLVKFHSDWPDPHGGSEGRGGKLQSGLCLKMTGHGLGHGLKKGSLDPLKFLIH